MKYSSVVGLKNELLSETKIVASTLNVVRSRSLIRAAAQPAMVAPARAPYALGVRGKKGKYQLAVRIHRRASGMEAILYDIHARCKGEMHVKIIGDIVKQQRPWHQRKNRPLQIGGSCGHFQITAGTLGCFVTKDGVDDLILSNNHVLANENKARRGANILQPGKFDNGRNPRDKIGDLVDFVRLKKKGNLVDCATATIDAGLEYFFNHLETLGPITGVRNSPMEEGETVFKVGRTTGVTQGKVSAIEVDQLKVGFDIGDLTFDSQIEIEPVGNEPFSLGGDSGSLIVDSRRKAVGLLFAGNDVDATYANDIHNVLDALNVDLVF